MIEGINIVLLFVDLDQYLYTSSNYLSTLFIQALLQGLINPTETKTSVRLHVNQRRLKKFQEVSY